MPRKSMNEQWREAIYNDAKQDAGFGFKDKTKNELVWFVLDPKKINDYINKFYDRNETRIYYSANPNKGMLIERRNFNNLWFYTDYLYYKYGIDRPTLTKILKNNTYKVQDKLIKMFKEIIDAPFKHLAIQKIKRNAIYNNGLGLKLAIKAYSKDFV